MSVHTENTYNKMNQFVNEMNASISTVGDMSIFLFNRFRNFIGYMFIAVTTIAIGFIVAEFVRGFEFEPIFGIEVYTIALVIAIIGGGYIAYFGESAKIATIKGSIFSVGSNRFWQFVASFVIITILVLVNAKGVQRIADFSLRYMNTQVESSVVFKLKQQKIENHAKLSQVNAGTGIGKDAIKALFQSRKSIQKAKKAEIDAIQNATDAWISGRNPQAYRTIIAQKRIKTAKEIATIEEKWNNKLAKIDWKIGKAQDKINANIITANQLRQSEMQKSDLATNDLISHYQSESTKNEQTIEEYKDIGLWVAVVGEIIDGILAFVFFMIVKSNPNTNGTPAVQENTRQLIQLEEYEQSNNLTVQGTIPSFKKKFPREEQIHLTSSLFEQIKAVAKQMAEEKNIYREGKLKHPTQRELIKKFKEIGIKLNARVTGQYLSKMENELEFINENYGFVYREEILTEVA